MHGTLNEQEMNNLLSSQGIGRIACTNGTQPYIVPVTYFFDGEYIYGQTSDGIKLKLLRKNPKVSFEVDMITDMIHWQSVVVRGRFEELHGEDAEEAHERFFYKHYSLASTSKVHLHEHDSVTEMETIENIKPVVYRIRIIKKTGRFQKR